HYLPFLNFPGVALVFCFFLAKGTLRLDDSDPVMVKKVSRIFLQPLRIRSSLHTDHPSSSGSLHLSSTELQFTTSGSLNSSRASLYSQSSGAGYFYKE
uniref:Uncharacterized protein n=1 Tax=Scleropages formosus TaxID=113540 RepID=A0A8C9VCW7_SCLFO